MQYRGKEKSKMQVLRCIDKQRIDNLKQTQGQIEDYKNTRHKITLGKSSSREKPSHTKKCHFSE